MSNKVILADNGNERMEADTILKNGRSSKSQKSKVNMFLTKTFRIIVMVGIIVPLFAFSDWNCGKHLNGTYVAGDWKLILSGNKFTHLENGKVVDVGTYELHVVQKKGNNSSGVIILKEYNGEISEKISYVLEGNKLTTKDVVWIKIK